ncbi:Sphingosine-1-phosphate lyase [Labilithrix luteola]|uniref:Sphingosine-1-phosphate lyase n=1 Tax=Labilithrix luteola TaxID=1391654 RepID=A0A0K1PVY1_9BACT|nr:aspartate aminotransferase family protein [Labilithrix luteola]AKU97683.1 Sphingosine-1-phosphate lyase [Labilithrix luteola]
MTIPQQGIDADDLRARMERYRGNDGDAAGARLFSLVYATRSDILDVAKDAYGRFFSENALNPMTFPSLRRFETEVLEIAIELLHGPAGAAGSMTSGGSESLLLAVKTARDWARLNRPHVTAPEMLLPVTAHPALLKAAHIVGVEPVIVPVTDAFVADMEAARSLVTDNTVLVVGSAPQYPHGVMDPITELAELAASRGILCHVDSCIGGFFLPWLEKLGREVPPFDFRVPGVTSISADLHKYAYAAKGASVLLHRSRALRRHQYFVHPDWPGGLFGSPSVLGTRPGGAIAAAWAVMHYLGAEGYLDLTRRAMDATKRMADGVREIPGLRILGNPVMSLLAIGIDERHADPVDLNVVADRMLQKGWRIDRQQRPTSLHLTVSPAHDVLAETFVADLREAVAHVRSSGEQAQGPSAMYGMLGQLPDRAFVGDALLDFMDGMDSMPTMLEG